MTNISVGRFNIIYKEFYKKDIKCQRHMISIFRLLGAGQTQQSPLLPEYLLINYFEMIIHSWSEYYILLVKVKSKVGDSCVHFLCWHHWHFCTPPMLAKWSDWLTVTMFSAGHCPAPLLLYDDLHSQWRPWHGSWRQGPGSCSEDAR